jgi:cytochrome c
MDSFELNKILGAILFTMLVVLSLGIVSEAIYVPHEPEEPGYAIAALEPGDGGEVAGGETEVEAVPIAVLLQDADPEAGAQAAKKCQSCHTFEKGGPNRVGPNLWGIVGAPMGHAGDFNYSQAMSEMQTTDDVWTFEKLSEFLTNPKAAVPGTAMAFAGLRRDQERADVIAFLRTLSDSPVPLPEPPVDTAEEPIDEAVAQGQEAAGEAAVDEAAEEEAATGSQMAPESGAQPMSPEAPPTVPAP